LSGQSWLNHPHYGWSTLQLFHKIEEGKKPNVPTSQACHELGREVA
jgi:hypothetical protein